MRAAPPARAGDYHHTHPHAHVLGSACGRGPGKCMRRIIQSQPTPACRCNGMGPKSQARAQCDYCSCSACEHGAKKIDAGLAHPHRRASPPFTSHGMASAMADANDDTFILFSSLAVSHSSLQPHHHNTMQQTRIHAMALASC